MKTLVIHPVMLILTFLAGIWFGHSNAKYARGKSVTKGMSAFALIVVIVYILWSQPND